LYGYIFVSGMPQNIKHILKKLQMSNNVYNTN
jgi:hypothetical protein